MNAPNPPASEVDISVRDSWIREANDALARDDQQRALDLLSQALERLPNDRVLLVKKAFVLRRLGRHREALACLEPAWLQDKRNVSTLMEMAANCLVLGDHERCVDLFRTVIEIDGRNKGAWLGLIDSMFALSDHEAALEYAETADLKMPEEFAFGLKQAVILRRLGRNQDAVSHLQTLLLRFPDATPVQLALGTAYREAGLFTQSRALYEEILSREPGNKAAWLGCIDAAISGQENQAALALVKRADSHLAGDIDLGIKAAVVLQKNGMYRAAIDRLCALTRSHPESIPAQLALTSACLTADDEGLFHKNAARLQELAPDDPALHERLAALANALGNWTVAEEQSKAVRTIIPDHIEAAIYLARSQLAMGKIALAEAIVSELRARQALPPKVEARADMTMAQIEHVKGNEETAIAFLNQAHRADPGNVTIIMNLITRTAAASREHEIGAMLDDLLKITTRAPNERLVIMLAEYGRLDEALAVCRDWHDLFPELAWIPEMIACLARLKGEASLSGDTGSVASRAPAPVRRKDQFKSFLDATWQQASDLAAFVKSSPPSSDPSVYAVAWSHCRVPGLDYAEWKRRADHATRTWMDFDEIFISDISELDALQSFMGQDDLSGLAPLVEEKRPCFIVSSHLGVPANIWFLSRRIPQFHYLSGWASRVSDDRLPPFRPLMTSLNNVATVRAIKRLIESGGMLGSSIDAPFVAFNPQFTSGYSYGPLCGQKFRISNLLPRLAHRFSVPTFWVQSVWKDERIVVEIEEIKVMGEGISEADWLSEWTAAYLLRLERLISSLPENLNLGKASAWRYLHARDRSPAPAEIPE